MSIAQVDPMAPAQPLVDIDPDCKPQLCAEIAPNNENGSSVPKTVTEGLSCIDDCEDNTIGIEVLMNDENKALNFPEDVNVDIIECRNKSDTRWAEAGDPDATEYSSSFGDTASDTENYSGFSEGEVESNFYGDNDFGSAFDAFSNVFQMRKKKLTNHWRNFIRPEMWRCKWMELRIKELELQALRYSRKLAACDQGKHSGVDQFTLEEFGSKSFAFSSQYNRKKAMKRMKRKRVEETTDTTSYMSHHNFFSYIENKKSDPDSTTVADEYSALATDLDAGCNDKLGTSDEWTPFEFRDTDDSLEQVLWKIETVHTWVHKLRNQIDMVVSKNAAKFSSSENLSLLSAHDVQTSAAHSPAFSAGNGDTISAGAIYASSQLIPEYDIDMAMPESVVSSFGEAIPVPDIIESTVGLLSAADVTIHQPQFGDSTEDIVDNILMHDEAAQREYIFEAEQTHQEREICDQEVTSPPIPSSEPDHIVKTVVSQEQSALETCLASEVHFYRCKRKRGERKAGSVVWSKRCSGDPDSQ